MAISYPLNFPTGVPIQASIQLFQNANVAINQSPWTGKQQVQPNAGQQWGVEIDLPIMEWDNARHWISFLVSLNGREGTFYLPSPRPIPLGSASGTPLIDGASEGGLNTISTDGWTPSTSGLLLKGDFIEVASRMLMVLADVNSDGSGDATIEVWPSTPPATANNTPIVTSNTKGLFRLSENINPFISADNAHHYDLSFLASEVL